MLRPVMSGWLLAAVAMGLAGCTTIPTGPSRMALPGAGTGFDTFRADDASCREYGMQVSGAIPSQAQNDAAVKSAPQPAPQPQQAPLLQSQVQYFPPPPPGSAPPPSSAIVR